MPNPKAGESKKDYIARFMKSSEATSDFPDEKQRLAVAYSMFEKKNAIPSYGKEHPWPKQYECNFIEPGVVFYQDLGACKICGDAFSCGEEKCQPEGATVLVKQEALEKMAKSFIGKPLIDMVHKDVKSNTIADGEADGIVTDVWLDPKSGWWKARFLAWDKNTQDHCESPAYSVSCAYEPTEVDSTGGEYHNIPFAEDILNGVYTHMAVVTNPRYEGARISRILVNSKGGKMSWKFWEKGARKNAAPLDPLKELVEVDGEQVPLQNLYDSLEDEQPKYNDDTVLETPKGEKTLGELKQAYRNKSKKNADKSCPTCGQEKLKENKESKDGEQHPLPDLRRTNADSKSDEEKKNAEAKAKEEEKKNAEAKADEEKKNALDKEAKADEEKKNAEAKAEEEKKNAEAKAEEEMKQAGDKADKEKELAEKRNAGRASFASLRNARDNEFTGGANQINPVSIDERLAKGKNKYGSA